MNFIQAYKQFWTPRFTTSQLDRSYTRGGSKFEITTLLFEDGHPALPSTILGHIITKLGNKRQVSWNQYGECFFYGNRMEDFDLVHPEQSEIDSAKFMFVCIIGILVVIISTILWN